MPGGDRTGPAGMGPMTGRRAGFCAGSGVPGFAGAAWGWGFGRRRGYRAGGWGRGRPFDPIIAAGPPWGAAVVPDPLEDKEALRRRADALQSELEALRRRLEALGSESETE
jgi:hypothetical protein